ncbi:hypothetical protein U1Q18_052392 [Sarracenia purpurea var. burkii]
MQEEFNGLKTLILKENESAYYVHCFAHQLQSALVAVAKNHIHIANLFFVVSKIVHVVGASCKHRDLFREKQAVNVIEDLHNGEITSGHDFNQERTLIRAIDTCWGSHYGTLISLIGMFSTVIDVLDVIVEDEIIPEQRFEASRILNSMQSFEFVFSLHLMRAILGITNDLSQALQRRDQDIVNAVKLVQISKQRLQMLKDNEWNSLMDEVSSFCGKHQIDVPNMDEVYVTRRRSRRITQKIRNSHHYHIELFNAVIDMQMQELNDRFNEVNIELLLCVACLNPSDSFAAFDKERLIRFIEFYPKDFSDIERLAISDQLENFIMDVRSTLEFLDLKGISDLAQMMVKTRKNIGYPLVYRLLTLALILPVATSTIERTFSEMKIVKNRLHSGMDDQWMHDSLVVYIEREMFNSISNEIIMYRFQTMKSRRGQL